MSTFECAKCKKAGKDARLISVGIIYSTYTCINCGDILDPNEDRDKVVSSWSFHGDNGDIDDHTSVWGGAGPDCSIVRREAAK